MTTGRRTKVDITLEFQNVSKYTNRFIQPCGNSRQLLAVTLSTFRALVIFQVPLVEAGFAGN